MTTHPEWDAALKTYLGRRALFDLETEIGETEHDRIVERKKS